MNASAHDDNEAVNDSPKGLVAWRWAALKYARRYEKLDFFGNL